MLYASIVRDPYYLEKLIEYGGDPSMKSRYLNGTIIFDATSYGAIKQVKVLINAEANIDHQNSDQVTPIMQAAFFAFYDIVYVLLEAGADIEKKSHSGRTLISIIEKKNINTKHWQYQWYKKSVNWLRNHGYEVDVEL